MRADVQMLRNIGKMLAALDVGGTLMR